MHHSGSYRSSVLVDIANYAGWPLLIIYGFAMFVWPWFAGHGSWRHVQDVWDRWQTFNAGALAFVASLVAFNIARFNESKQRERDFVAAKAFLPSTLSGLMAYFKDCAHLLNSMWNSPATAGAALANPELPSSYREVFSNCIRHADPAVGVYLSNILVLLQVHDARLREALGEAAKGSRHVVDRYTLLAYFLKLGELYARAAHLFPFARGEERFEGGQLTWEQMRTAYALLDLEIEDLSIDEDMNLQAFTKRWIARQGKSSEAQLQ